MGSESCVCSCGAVDQVAAQAMPTSWKYKKLSNSKAKRSNSGKAPANMQILIFHYLDSLSTWQVSGEKCSVPCGSLGMGHVAPHELEELILGHAGLSAGLLGILVMGDGSICDCSPICSQGAKRSVKFISDPVLPGSLQIRVIRGNIEGMQLEGVSQGHVQSTPACSQSQVRGGVRNFTEPCKPRSSERLVCLLDSTGSNKKKRETSGQTPPGPGRLC